VRTDPELRRLALAGLLLGFTGPTPPRWLLDALRDGLGGVVLFGSNLRGADPRRLTDRLREAAGRDVVVALDEEGGDVTRLDDTRGSRSPGAAALGHLDDPAVTEEAYAGLGARLAGAGVTVDLAPVADVNVEPLNPVIGVRSFGADPQRAARHVAAAVRGIQRSGVAACVKHFPGHGATTSDSHHEVATLARTGEQLRAVEWAPFRAAIAAGTRAVMTGHLLAPALDPTDLATISPAITSTALRGELGFAGTVVTDALEMRAVSGTIGMVEGFVRALGAGADAVETGALDYPELVDAVPAAVAAAVDAGRLGRDRVADAARRTAELARAGSAAPVDLAMVAGAAAGCLELIGEVPELPAPVLFECRPEGGMASGELPWSFAQPLADCGVHVECHAVRGAAEASAAAGVGRDRALLAVVRDPDRHPWQQDVLAAAAAHPAALVIDVGWPGPTAPRVPTLRTRGVAPGLLAAAAALVAARVR
jgi:beta-N-acetylhexosaminidase